MRSNVINDIVVISLVIILETATSTKTMIVTRGHLDGYNTFP